MKKLIILLAVIIIKLNALAQSPGGNDIVVQQKPENFFDQRFPEVTVTTDIQFNKVKDYKGKETELYLDLYEAKNDHSYERPVIIWIHGGGFRTGSTRKQNYIVRYCADFAKRGYVCISIDYRLRSGTDMPDRASEFPALQDGTVDAFSAIEWVRQNSVKYRLDPDLIFVAGGSAGGRIAATVSQFPGPANAKAKTNTVEAAPWNKNGLVAAAILWGGPEPEMRGWLYPYLQKSGVPTVLIHGDADSTINVQNSIDLNDALKLAGISSELNIIKGAPHTPGGKSNELLIESWIAHFFVREWTKKGN
jgi:acetyl esterase/lipase